HHARYDLCTDPTGHPRFVHGDETASTTHGGEDGVAVERTQCAQIEDLQLDALLSQFAGRAHGEGERAAHRNHRHVATLACDTRLADRRFEGVAGHRRTRRVRKAHRLEE